jgi:hypothetical protein
MQIKMDFSRACRSSNPKCRMEICPAALKTYSIDFVTPVLFSRKIEFYYWNEMRFTMPMGYMHVPCSSFFFLFCVRNILTANPFNGNKQYFLKLLTITMYGLRHYLVILCRNSSSLTELHCSLYLLGSSLLLSLTSRKWNF